MFDQLTALVDTNEVYLYRNIMEEAREIMEKKIHPKVFISYSWTVQEKVIQLAQRLVNDGIDTIVDFWHLKPGNDKYKFMESMVTDNTIDFVLIVCDKTYAEKANDRTGGVGDETVILSSELYGKFKQEKFLSLILEKMKIQLLLCLFI